MKVRSKSLALILTTLCLMLGGNLPIAETQAAPSQPIQAPSLKWQRGGCYQYWCDSGWYSSPAVADLDGDGTQEVVGANSSVFVLDGATGSVEWQVSAGHDRSQPVNHVWSRTWPGVIVADVDGDGALEIVTAHWDGHVSVYDQTGYFEPGWPQRPTANEVRGVSAYDLDGDGTLEIIVTGGVYDEINTWVLEHDGQTRSGWPQLINGTGYPLTYGVWSDNAVVGDLDGDGMGEIVVPSDMHFICAYERDGGQIPASSAYGGRTWCQVDTWESLEVELRGWGGTCDGTRKEGYRPDFPANPGVIADVNGDGTVELVVTGRVHDCHDKDQERGGKYVGVYIFNADRSRFNDDGYDWRDVPVDTGAPLSEMDYDLIWDNVPHPVVVDLDGDGVQEIVYPASDGRVHAFWLDKTEHHNWPYSVYDPNEGFYRFASEPVVADLDNDGQAEVIFSSWVQKGIPRHGRLHILDYQGNPLHEIDLPPGYGYDWNGGMAAPTLADIDSDPDLEVVLNTDAAGVVAYDLPGTANARILWGTGRWNYQRTGSLAIGTLAPSHLSVSPRSLRSGDVMTYTIQLVNPGPVLSSVRVTDTLPAEVHFLGDLWASSGISGQAENPHQPGQTVVTWSGPVSSDAPVTISFGVEVKEEITTAQSIVNTALLDDGQGHILQVQATAIVNGNGVYLPSVRRQ